MTLNMSTGLTAAEIQVEGSPAVAVLDFEGGHGLATLTVHDARHLAQELLGVANVIESRRPLKRRTSLERDTAALDG